MGSQTQQLKCVLIRVMKLVPGEIVGGTACRSDLGHAEIPHSQCTGFIENHCSKGSGKLQIIRPFDQDADS